MGFVKNKMQVDQEEQKNQSDGPKENVDKKSDTEDMEVTKKGLTYNDGLKHCHKSPSAYCAAFPNVPNATWTFIWTGAISFTSWFCLHPPASEHVTE